MDTNVAPSTPVPSQQPIPQKTQLSFSSLPMKLTALVFLSILIIGAFVISQKNKAASNMYNANTNAMTAVSPTTISTTTSAMVQESGVPSPTVAGQIALTVTSPQNGTTVTTPNIVITGKTIPNADVTINDAEMKADATGSFSQSVILDEGDNIITITSVDPNGNYTERELKITLNTGV